MTRAGRLAIASMSSKTVTVAPRDVLADTGLYVMTLAYPAILRASFSAASKGIAVTTFCKSLILPESTKCLFRGRERSKLRS